MILKGREASYRNAYRQHLEVLERVLDLTAGVRDLVSIGEARWCLKSQDHIDHAGTGLAAGLLALVALGGGRITVRLALGSVGLRRSGRQGKENQ